MIRSLPTLLLLFAASPALGAETPWQQVMPGVAIRLVASEVHTPSDTTWLAIEIDMPGDTKTYWRVPGESGIPPRLDFVGSKSVGGYEIAWPFPERVVDAGYLDHAYYGHTLLPIEVEVEGAAPEIALDANLGICSDVCVPVRVVFELPLDLTAPDRANALRIQQARAEVPVQWEGEPVVEHAYFDPETASLVVALAADFPAPTAIADIAGKMLLFGPPLGDDRQWTFPLLGKAAASQMTGEHLHLTFTTPNGPYEIVHAMGTKAP